VILRGSKEPLFHVELVAIDKLVASNEAFLNAVVRYLFPLTIQYFFRICRWDWHGLGRIAAKSCSSEIGVTMRNSRFGAMVVWIACAVCAVLFVLGSFAVAMPGGDSGGDSAPKTSAADQNAPMETAGSSVVSPARQVRTPPAVKPRSFDSAGKIGIGVKVSSLGAGFEVAVPVMSRANIRAGFNMFNFERTLSQDGVSYQGKLNFRSSEAYFDWFPFGGSFHLSPGVVLYNGNKITANASVPPNQTFSFNGQDYASDANDPLTGDAKLDFKRLDPAFLVGWGNLAPRGRRHWSIPLEFGAVYQNAPRLLLNFSGSACDAGGVNCQAVAGDPSFQSNLQAERDKLNHDLAPFKFYPVISIGFGYKF